MQMNTPENQNAIFRMLIHEIQRLGSVSEATLRFEWTMEPDPGTNGWDPNDDGALHFLRRVADPDYHVRHVEYGDGPIPGQEVPSGHQTIAEIAGWSVGTVGHLHEPDADDHGDGFHEDDPVALEHDDGTSAPLFRHVVTSRTKHLHLDQVTPGQGGSDCEQAATHPWQVGDRAVITGPGGGHFFRVGEVVHLAKHEPDGIHHYWRSARTGDRWAVPPSCVRREEAPEASCVRREEAPEASCVVEAGDNTFWQVGDRFKIIDTDGGHGFDHGEVVELVTRDEGSGLSIHDYRSVTTGSIAGVADYRLQRLGAPEPGASAAEQDTTLWQVGDRFEVVDSDGHPFAVGETVELAEQDPDAERRLQKDGYTIHDYRGIHGSKVMSVKSHRLRRLEHEETPKEPTPATRMGLRVGDRATVNSDYGFNPNVEPGDLVELIDDDGTHNPWFRNLSKGGKRVAVTLTRVTPTTPEAPAPETPHPDTPAGHAGWQVGDRGTVIVNSLSGSCRVGDHVELTEDDKTSCPFFHNLTTGQKHVVIDLDRVCREAPEEAPEPSATEGPTAGEVWHVSTPMLPDGALVKMLVEDLTDRVATLRPVSWWALRDRYVRDLDAEPIPMERDRVRFVERVQGAEDR